jgi:flagellar basal-body rod protein FlgB
MNYLNIPLFNVMKTQMGYLSARQSALAQNVANADTPGYKAIDIAKPDFARMLAGTATPRSSKSGGGLPMSASQPGHVQPHMQAAGAFQPIKRSSTYELSPSGNNVSIEEEMSMIAENQAEYTKTLNLYRKTVDMFKTAIGRPGGSA